MTIVDVEDLTKRFHTGMKKGDVVALDSVSLTIEEGEILGLVGPNGAGKTTLMKILLGICSPTGGRVRLFGLAPENPASRERVGYLPEEHRFPDYLTGLGLLELTGRMYGMDRRVIAQRAEYLLPLVELEKWAYTKIRNYSKGMLRRIGMAQAMISDPDLLLLDEPTDGIDPVGKVQFRHIMESIRSEGKTIILNSHLLSEVESVSDRVAILSKGRLVRTSSISSLTTSECRFVVEAEIGSKLVEFAEEIGEIAALTATRLVIDLTDVKHINTVIDELRRHKINISAVNQEKVTLEQSFIEAITEDDEVTQ